MFRTETPVSLPIVVSRTNKPGCFTLTNEVEGNELLPYTDFSNTFTRCQDCLDFIKLCPVNLTDCSTNEQYSVSSSYILSLPFVPQINQIYLITIYNGEQYIQSCFYINEYSYGRDFECKSPVQLWSLISISPSSFGLKDVIESCEICRESVPSYWPVKECISGTVYIVSLPAGTEYKDYGITFTRYYA